MITWRRILSRGGLLAGLLLFGGGCSEGETALGQLLLYSGASAPEWTVRASAVQGLRERLAGLSPTQAPAGFPRFGILGLAVHNERGLPDLPAQIIVSGGVVQTVSADQVVFYRDDREIGELLVRSAVDSGVTLGGAP